MNDSLFLIVKTTTDLYASLLLVRLLLQLVQADFYNPISQTILKICAPVVEPLHRLLPTFGRFNTAVLVAALLVKWLCYLALAAMAGVLAGNHWVYLSIAFFDLLRLLIEIYFWGIFILVLSSWVGTGMHPAVALVSQIVEPYLRPFRKLIPPVGMIDISPMVAIFTLMIIRAQVL
ncbi:MAG: YggT family protein [Porticoccaceae bacterium]